MREAAARETRRRIRTAAADLFVASGYAATSMRAIAAAAGVSERTVFLAFPTKAALLGECVRVAIRGGDEDTALLARDRMRAVLDAPPERMLGLLADASAELMGRAARLLAVGESVGPDDPVLNEVRERGRAATRSDMLEVAPGDATRRCAGGGDVRGGGGGSAVLAASESVYIRLVHHQGRSPEDYARMLERALAGALWAERRAGDPP